MRNRLLPCATTRFYFKIMEEEKRKKISKSLSYWLRHRPESIGIKLSDGGWTDVKELMEKAKKEIAFDFNELKEVVQTCDKQRFSFSEDFCSIRASQGHSVKVKLDFKEIAAPPVLYHGTAEQFLESIQKKGLVPGKRHHVHLSKDIETASKVGQRHGKLVILTIDTIKMQDAGFIFYISDNGVYLTESVPKKYIKF
jgi:putative RNA 2'-phosphotransferase